MAFDYFSSEIIESPSLFMRYARAVINATGEPWRFGLDNTPPARERVASFLKECGLSLDKQYTIASETRGKRALGGFAIAVVPPAAILESGQSAQNSSKAKLV